MKIKHKKPILIMLSLVFLFIISVGFIHHSNIDNFEWGNVSDWLSSLSTFGTLLVAYGAFIKAPDWLFQKRYEVASRIINETIFDDLLKLSRLCSQYNFKYHSVSKQLTKSLTGKIINEQRLKENCTELDETFTELFSLAITMKNKLKIIRRNGFEFTEYMNRIYNELIAIASNYNAIDTEITCSTLDAIDFDLSDESDSQIYIDTIFHLKRKVENLSNSFQAFARQIDEDNKMVEEFIISIKK